MFFNEHPWSFFVVTFEVDIVIFWSIVYPCLYVLGLLDAIVLFFDICTEVI